MAFASTSAKPPFNGIWSNWTSATSTAWREVLTTCNGPIWQSWAPRGAGLPIGQLVECGQRHRPPSLNPAWRRHQKQDDNDQRQLELPLPADCPKET
jgi:hypothetical protein